MRPLVACVGSPRGRELIEPHVEEDEDLFSAVDEKVSGDELVALAKQMKPRFAEVVPRASLRRFRSVDETSADVSQS